jgi:ribosome-associated toxin RatA of RatAB toxin-antitoxin module
MISKDNLRFGVRALQLFEKAKGVPISKALQDLESIESQIEFLFCAAQDYELYNKLTPTVTKEDIFSLYDEIGFVEASEIIGKGVSQYFTKKNTNHQETITQ